MSARGGLLRRAAIAALLLLLAPLAIVAPTAAATPTFTAGQDDGHAQEAAAQDEHAEEGAAQDDGHADDEAAQDDHADDAAHGGDEEHGEGAEHEAPTWGEYIAKWINFGLLAVLLYWLLVVPPAFVIENFEFPGLKVVLRDRAAGIVAAQQLAREQRVDADRRLEESAQRLDKVEQEVEGLLHEAEQDATQERQRLGAQAIEEAALIRASADRDMQTETKRARRELRTHVATLATGIAADILRDNFSSADQDRLMREYLDRLGGSVA